MADDETRWTIDELMSELRARARTGGPSATRELPQMPGAAPASVPEPRASGVVPRFRRIDELSSAELVSLVNAQQRVIYGVDGRMDIGDVTDTRVRTLADSCAALVELDDLTPRAGGGFTLKTTSYKTSYNLCSNEPFANQPLGCFCSGVLVGPDIIATAGHCVKGTSDLGHIAFVFGFHMKGEEARTEFDADDVYRGKEVIGRKLTADATDWALVRLDRVVAGRTPVTVREDGNVPDGEPLFVIGHPCGLPQKFADGANVRSNQPAAYFVANLDTYGGNSGSPVFSTKSHQLEGLLVRGQTDFVQTGSCYVSLVFPTTGGGGEDVSRASEWVSLLKPR